MRLSDLAPDSASFRPSSTADPELQAACEANPDLASFHHIGRSREGRPLYGVELGFGPKSVTLIAGSHADEPVGPETLRVLVIELLAHRDWLVEEGGFASLLQRFTLRIIPQMNPDGEARNWPWIQQWPSLDAYLRLRTREAPGDDIEFGYPVMRAENRAATRFLFDYEPVALHMSLHGMAFGEGALLLIDRLSSHRTGRLQEQWLAAVSAAGLSVHDHDRKGEKGFQYLGPGFSTTPEGSAMRAHFRQLGDDATASRFHHSSMEWAQWTGYDAAADRYPLALVTELPLFVIGARYPRQTGRPTLYLELQRVLSRLFDGPGADLAPQLERFQLTPLTLETAIRLQLRAIELGLEAA